MLSDPFIAAIERAMAKLPEDRFPDAATMRQALMGKRGHVSGSQMVVRVSSSRIPQVTVDERTVAASMPQITVNGETVDARALQPKPGTRPPPTRAELEARLARNRALTLAAIGVIMVSLVVIALLYTHHRRLIDEPALTESVPPLPGAAQTPDAPPSAEALPRPTPPEPQIQAVPEPTIPPPPTFGARPVKGKNKRKGCDPFDPYCR